MAVFTIIATLIPLLTSEEWFVRIFDFPRLQIFFMALASLLLFYFFDYRKRKRGRALLIILVITIIYQAINIYPYTPLAPNQVEYSDRDSTDSITLKILISNVFMKNTQYNKLIRLIDKNDPDLVLTLESDSIWQQALDPIKKEYPHKVEVPLSNTYGMHLYSKLPLRQSKVTYLLDRDIPSIKTFVQLRNGSWVEFHGVHPKPPVPGEDGDSRKRDAEIIIIANRIKESKYPVVVAGDFNDVAWSATTELFQEVSGLLDPRIGRGFYNTFNANYILLRWPLDHVFHSNHFKLISMKRLENVGSDHFPIFIDLSFEPDEKHEQEKPEQDEDTTEEKNETIKEGIQAAKGKK